MKMELMYQRPKVDYTVATLLAMLPLFGTNNKKKKVLFIMEIGVFITPWWNLRCIMLFFFFSCSKSFQYSALRCNVSIILLTLGQFSVCFWE